MTDYRCPVEIIVDEMRQELRPLVDSREEFLAQCAHKRINERIIKYNQEFDKYLEMIQTSEIYREDLSRLADSLKRLSSLVVKSYDGLINQIDKFQRNIFDHKD